MKETITLLLSNYLKDVLGEAHSATICWESVEILQLKASKCPELIHVQTTDRDGHRLEHPRLWRWSAWKADCESFLHAQKRSEEQRIARFIFEKNMHLTSRGITRFSGIEGDAANVLAYRHLKRGHINLITNIFGVRLITKKEEL